MTADPGLYGLVHLAVELGRLPSELMATATSVDIGLLQDYYAAQAEARKKAAAEAELLSGADQNASDARRNL
jgi:hypothetical protein